jgi:hypothetical protein
MVRNGGKILLSMLVVLLAFGAVGSVLAEQESKPVTMVGIVEEDNSITDDAGTNYMFQENDKAGELAEHIGQKVEITGTLEESPDGAKVITVENYKLLE